MAQRISNFNPPKIRKAVSIEATLWKRICKEAEKRHVTKALIINHSLHNGIESALDEIDALLDSANKGES